jgi:hypothetical protein
MSNGFIPNLFLFHINYVNRKGVFMEWIDENHAKNEMSDKMFWRKIQKEAKTRDMKCYGRDGIFPVFQERYSYKGVSYIIKICRYYQIGVPLNEIHGMNQLGKWATLEYPPFQRIHHSSRFSKALTSS